MTAVPTSAQGRAPSPMEVPGVPLASGASGCMKPTSALAGQLTFLSPNVPYVSKTQRRKSFQRLAHSSPKVPSFGEQRTL